MMVFTRTGVLPLVRLKLSVKWNSKSMSVKIFVVRDIHLEFIGRLNMNRNHEDIW